MVLAQLWQNKPKKTTRICTQFPVANFKNEKLLPSSVFVEWCSAVCLPDELLQLTAPAAKGGSFGTRAGVKGARITPRADGVLTNDFASSNWPRTFCAFSFNGSSLPWTCVNTNIRTETTNYSYFRTTTLYAFISGIFTEHAHFINPRSPKVNCTWY